MNNISCVVQIPSIVGECPTWCERRQVLFWVDIQGKKLHRYCLRDGSNSTYHLPDIVTALALCEDETKLLLTLRKRIALFDLPTEALEILATIEAELPDNRFNDAKCDTQGRLWPGTMHSVNWSSPEGTLYRCDTAFHYEKMHTQVTCSNGLGWSPDNKTMYFSDSFRYTIFAFDYDAASGAIKNRRPFVTLDPQGGSFPDGLTVDAEGYVWSAQVGKGQVVRYTPIGQQDCVIQFPVPRTTSCTFGGKEMRTLYVTSATETLTAQQINDAPLN
jgi:sugar lactone lactonase YvrE